MGRQQIQRKKESIETDLNYTKILLQLNQIVNWLFKIKSFSRFLSRFSRVKSTSVTRSVAHVQQLGESLVGVGVGPFRNLTDSNTAES